MKVVIKGSPEEVAALVVAVQGQRNASAEELSVGFPSLDRPDAYADNLVAKHNNVPDIHRGTE